MKCMESTIRIMFAEEGLEESVRLCRIVAGCEGPDIALATAKENFSELNRLLPVAEERLGSRHLIEIESRCYSALGASETRVRLEPTPWFIERVNALGVRTPDH